MATSIDASNNVSHPSPPHRRRRERVSSDVDAHPTTARLQVNVARANAAEAVAFALARVMAERYSGTSWLPVKSSRSDDRFVVPAGKVIRLLSSPADMDTSDRIRGSASSTPNGRASHEHGADAGSQ